jgi:hypothetical protein
MTTPALLSIGAFALLFIVYALLPRPNAGCGSQCDVCQHACKTINPDGDHVD